MRKILLILILASTALAVDIIPLSQVEKGQKGYGLSVFSGTEPEKFGVEIMGVLKNINVDSSLIIAKLSGKRLEKEGVISGMSGSPVFIDGKLIGAVAYGFTFSKEPIAGIVPIEEILKKGEASTSTSVSSEPKIVKRLDFRKFLNRLQPPRTIGNFQPLPVPVNSSVHGNLLSLFSKKLGLASSSGGGKIEPKIELEDINNGDAVSLLLITGDIDLSVGGTVVYNDKNKNRVYIFGHPFLNTGPANYFLAKSEVIGTVPSYSSPFKLMQPTKLVGRVVEDRSKAVVGEVGKLPKYIPVSLKYSSPIKRKKYNFWVIDDQNLTPILMMIAEEGIISEGAKEFGDISLEVSGEISIKNSRNIVISDFFVGKSVPEVLGFDAAIVYYLQNNPYKKAEIGSISLNYKVYEYDKTATITKVWLPKYKVNSGERVNVTVFVKPKNGREEARTYPVKIPRAPVGKNIYLMVSSAEDIIKWESTYYKVAVGFPPSFNKLIKVLNNLRKNNRLYFKFFSPEKSLFIGGEEYPSLPPSMMHLFTSPFLSDKGRTIPMATIMEYTAKLPFYIKGSKTIKLSIGSAQ